MIAFKKILRMRESWREFIDWLKTKPTEYFKRIELKDGGNVFFISDYLKQKEEPKIKELDLAVCLPQGKL